MPDSGCPIPNRPTGVSTGPTDTEDPCLCRKAGESTEDCPWGCDRATPQELAAFDQRIRSMRSRTRGRRW